jgi:2-C-methyl-D-erythritol 4-phosphate cytidylyltransferase
MELKGVILNKFSCIILAGGKGTRFGAKKQNIKWHGKPLWKHVYDKCIQVSDDVIVVGYSIHGRQGAVYNGLRKVKYDKVVILEAARPAVTVEQIQMIANVNAPSVSYIIKSVDTIHYYGTHLDRRYCYLLQVPQAFNTNSLRQAHQQCKKGQFTSDTELMELTFNIKSLFIIGGRNLMKVTYPEDLKILDVIINESK